jgi:hypothetical protein
MDDLKEITENFKRANQDLIEQIKEGGSNNKALEYLKGIDEKYTKAGDDQYNIFLYAEIQLGLAKSLDFLLPYSSLNNNPNQPNQIIKNINSVVDSALAIIQFHINQCSLGHEDGACLVGGLNYARLNTGSKRHKPWPELPMAHALNFLGKITPKILRKNTTIYRIIGDDGENWNGHWWLEMKPTNKKIWRSKSAVSKQWNEGTQCVEVDIKEDMYYWSGIAASQAVPNSSVRCYLPGGEYQLWLDPSNLPKPDIKKWP